MPFSVLRAHLAAISSAHPLSCAFDLHAKEILTIFDADVIGAHVRPRLADGEAAARGLRHELQLDPLALLFAGGEALPKFHVSPESA